MTLQVWDANSAPVFCTLRTRKCCEVFWCALHQSSACACSWARVLICGLLHASACKSCSSDLHADWAGPRQGELQRVHHVLNECLIDRGASPSMVSLEISVDGHHVTTAQVSMLWSCSACVEPGHKGCHGDRQGQ